MALFSIIPCANNLGYRYSKLHDHTLDDNETLCALDNGRHHPAPDATLGALDTLPLELLNMLLTLLDIRSLTDFRRVNQRAMQVVNSIPQYRTITEHAPTSLRAMLSIGTGRWISSQDLYNKLYTAECDICGDFGGYLYLLTCRRVCFCFTQDPAYLPLWRADAARKFGLSREYLAGIPAMKTIPGFYSPRELKVQTRITLLDHDSALRAGVAVHGSVGAMGRYVSEVSSEEIERYRERALQHSAGAGSASPDPTPRQPRVEDEFDGYESNPKRFVAVVRAPVLKAQAGSRMPEWGFHCVACKGHHYGRPLHWRRLYTEESFRDHLDECGDCGWGACSVIHLNELIATREPRCLTG
ncbi:hypothetical protein BDW74DRAFT_178251 [Aspergillus multicolor]|uniref:uncharacterized protein n=1 Tax=Aspergillus multicolor TaxID=41759 RepID=UPI003CCD5910